MTGTQASPAQHAEVADENENAATSGDPNLVRSLGPAILDRPTGAVNTVLPPHPRLRKRTGKVLAIFMLHCNIAFSSARKHQPGFGSTASSSPPAALRPAASNRT